MHSFRNRHIVRWIRSVLWRRPKLIASHTITPEGRARAISFDSENRIRRQSPKRSFTIFHLIPLCWAVPFDTNLFWFYFYILFFFLHRDRLHAILLNIPIFTNVYFREPSVSPLSSSMRRNRTMSKTNFLILTVRWHEIGNRRRDFHLEQWLCHHRTKSLQCNNLTLFRVPLSGYLTFWWCLVCRECCATVRMFFRNCLCNRKQRNQNRHKDRKWVAPAIRIRSRNVSPEGQNDRGLRVEPIERERTKVAYYILLFDCYSFTSASSSSTASIGPI